MDAQWDNALLPGFRQEFEIIANVEITDHPATVELSDHDVDMTIQIADVIVSGKDNCVCFLYLEIQT